VQGLKPIYSDSPDALVDARGDLRGADSFAALPAWLNDYQPLAADLRAQATTGKSRPVRRFVALKVVLIDESAPGRDRLGEVIMEQVADEAAKGELYAADTMAGVITDDAWRGALDAAHGYAREFGCGIAPETDVRWSVRVLQPGEKWEDWEDTDENKPRPLKAGQSITGRSAGVAFFLGLFALAQGEGAASGWQARKVVESIVALATLPETETRASVNLLGTLGGAEKRKLEALRNLPKDSGLFVLFPSAFTGTIHGRHEPLPVTTVGGLFEVLRERCAATSRPDSLPVNRGAGSYIGGGEEVERMTKALSEGGWHVVTGPGGVGKTARVIAASAPLWDKGLFRGGRLWINLYEPRETGRTADIVAAGAIVTACDRKREEKHADLRTQAFNLLVKDRSLVLLEGAETVPEREIAAVLDLFPPKATVVWMTRQVDDAQHPSLRRAVPHSVQELGHADALKLLCYAAGCEVAELPAAERPVWEEIAKATQRLPLFLGWAGEALRSCWGTTAVDYLAELYAFPLSAIADSRDPEMRNAGKFLSSSFARIKPTTEMPDLPEVAERLFAGLAAFDPSYGAPLAWWPLAADLDTTKAAGQRLFIEARRRLRDLGLVTSQAPPVGAKAIGATVHAVHALAGTVATDMWLEQEPAQRAAALGALCRAASASLDAPLPPDWFRDASLIAGRTSQAAHFSHWVYEMETFVPGASPASDNGEENEYSPIHKLLLEWFYFLAESTDIKPLIALTGAALTGIIKGLQQMSAADHVTPELACIYKDALRMRGEMLVQRQDLPAAEAAYNEALISYLHSCKQYQYIQDYYTNVSEVLRELAGVRVERNNLSGAELALSEAIMVLKEQAENVPDAAEHSYTLAGCWVDVAYLRAKQMNLLGAEEALREAISAMHKAVTVLRMSDAPYPYNSVFQEYLALVWDKLAAIRTERNNPLGAEEAAYEAMFVRKQIGEARSEVSNAEYNLTEAQSGEDMPLIQAIRIKQVQAAKFPDVPEYQCELAQTWEEWADTCMQHENFLDAQEACNGAFIAWNKVAEKYPDSPHYQNGLASVWKRIADVSNKLGNLKGAEDALLEAIMVWKTLEDKYPDVPAYQSDLARTWKLLAGIRTERNNLNGLEDAFRQAIMVWEKLIDRYPDVPSYQNNLALAWECLGFARLQDWYSLTFALESAWRAGVLDAREHADNAFDEAMMLWEDLVERFPDSSDYQTNLARVEIQLM
jgi:tetratricopeptide (TPR) repeat protein